MFNFSKSIILNLGTFGGLLAFALFLVLYYLGVDPLGNYSWLGIWIPITIGFLAIKKYQDTNPTNNLSYSKKFFLVLFTIAVYASFFALIVVLFVTLVAPEFVETKKALDIAQLEELSKLMNDENLFHLMTDEIKTFTIKDYMFGDFLNKLLGGVFLALIIPLFFNKTVDTPFVPDENKKEL